MKFHYQFSNLLGTVYRQGNLLFTPDGSSVVSPVGNKLSVYDLKSHTSTTLPVESRSNFTVTALSPNGITLLAANEEGEIHLISLISRSVLHTLRTNRPIAAVRFSPDARHFAVARENNVYVYRAPGPHTREYSPFALVRVLKGARDDTTCIQWSDCSRIVAVGSRDTSTRLYAFERLENFTAYTLGGHTEPVVGVFFDKGSLCAYTVSRNGHLAVWECSVEPAELVAAKHGPAMRKKKEKGKSQNKAADEESEDEVPDEEGELADESNVEAVNAEDNTENGVKTLQLYYKRNARHYLRDHLSEETKRGADLAAVDYHQLTKILVTGFSNGVFLIHEMPNCNMIHSLCISEQGIASVAINATGDWIGFGCSKLGQLLVWEWQSETYVLKQQGHFNNMACLAYSPDGQHIVTGGEDGKVKVWSASSGFSFVTFDEHASSVTGVTFAPNGKVVLSASLDGTVRAFDMARYRNFRTFASPRPAQFGCVAVDASGELVAAGGTDVYEIYLWSVQTGRLMEVLSGHEGPVSCLRFSPSPASSALVSASWDKTLRIWDALAVSSSNEAVPVLSDATAVDFRPDGQQVAVATLNGHITFFDVKSGSQTGTIEGRADLGSGRSDTDLITAKKSLQGKCFLSLCYSADGTCILAAGQSKNICIYNVGERLLVKTFEITQNRSFDAMDEVISRKKMTEFGNLDLVEDRDDQLGSSSIKLPGAKRGDMSSRSHRPEVRVADLQFSPTGREFSAATTEGLLIYSLDSKLVFDPLDLDVSITPASIRAAVKNKNFSGGLLMALRLNENDLVREVMEQIPHSDVDLLATDLPQKYVPTLLKFVGGELEHSRHLHFYAIWAYSIVTHHSRYIQQKAGSAELMPVLNQLHKNLVIKSRDMTQMCEQNLHSMKFILAMAKLKKVAVSSDEGEHSVSNEGPEAGEEEDGDSSEEESQDEMEFATNWESD